MTDTTLAGSRQPGERTYRDLPHVPDCTDAVRKRVLVIEDEPELLQSLKLRLEHAGYEVVTAEDGACATALAFKTVPDVIVMDIGLPCGDGHEVTNRLRSRLSTVTVPIIYLTARTASEDRHKAVESGVYAYVTKPFNSAVLLSIVRQALLDEG